MKVLVTGGAGFIGSHIVDGLRAAGHGVAVLDDLSSGERGNLPGDVPLHVADIVDTQAVARVFAAERPDVTTPAPESFPANPVSPYGITKWVGERYLKFFAEEHGLEGVALRYSNVYGPRQNPHGEAGVVAIFCKKYLAGEPATINGDGRYVRDYVAGADVARANISALVSTAPEIAPGTLTSLNIGTGIGTDVNELEALLRTRMVELLADSGRSATLPPPVHGPARPGDLRSNLIDASRAGALLGWQPRMSLADGLADTAGWFARQRSN